MATVTFDHVSKRFAADTTAVNELDITVADGEFLVLVGPSGCGKTTALRCVAGLETITEGRVLIGDRVVNDVPPKDRDIAMVFQSYALYPHMSVLRQLGLRAPAAQDAQGGHRSAGEEGGRHPGPGEIPGPQATGTVRRAAATGCARPGHRPRTSGLPHGRAAVEPRRQAAGPDPRRDSPPPAPDRDHHPVRHPRPGRGHDHGRPDRGHERRGAPAGRDTARCCTTTPTTYSSPASSGRQP